MCPSSFQLVNIILFNGEIIQAEMQTTEGYVCICMYMYMYMYTLYHVPKCMHGGIHEVVATYYSLPPRSLLLLLLFDFLDSLTKDRGMETT